MNKFPIVALVLLMAGMALVLNSAGISCPFAGDNSTCQVNGNCTGNCSVKWQRKLHLPQWCSLRSK